MDSSLDKVICKIEIPGVEGLKPNEITVGRHVLLNCEGVWDKSFDLTKAHIKVDEAEKFIFKIQKAEARSAQAFDLDLTIYAAGQMRFPSMILTDGTRDIDLGAREFQTQSVIEKTESGQPPKPYGFIFPLKLEWPALYFVLIGMAIVLFIAGLIWQIRRAARFAKLIADLQAYKSSVPADLQFYKTLRFAEKKDYPLEEVEKAFRLYALRLFDLPMFVLSNRQIVSFMKKRKSHFKNERVQLAKILSEFEEIQKNKKELSHSEKNEFVQKLYRFVDRTQQLGKST